MPKSANPLVLGQPLVATCVAGPLSSRLFYISDLSTRLCHTGAEVSIVPPTRTDLCRGPAGLTLQAVNSTSIPTFGTHSLALDLGVRRSFQWLFIITDVKKTILGADFLQHYKLLVDVGNRRIMDTLTQLKLQGNRSDEPAVLSPTLLHRTPSNSYEAILSDFPSLTKPYNKEQPIKHDVTHHIKTTDPPVSSHTRRLSPQRLKIACQEFGHMIQLGIIRSSSSSWSSPLHMLPKKAPGNWCPTEH